MRLLLACMVALAGANRLVEVSMTTQSDQAKILQLIKGFTTDREDFESIGDDVTQVWLNDTAVERLRAYGLVVKTEGVIDWTAVNSEAAFAANYMHEDGMEPDWRQYCDYNCLTSRLQDLARRCAPIMSLSSNGRTSANRELWVVRVHNGNTEPKPKVLMNGNIHGDEVTGGQLLQRLLWEICEYYQEDARLGAIVSQFDLYVQPMFNPDGFMRRSRGNGAGADLNRGFPNRWTSPNDTPTGRQPEVRFQMEFVRRHDFVTSIMYHGGAEVVNYPYDSRQPNTRGYSATDRDAEVIALSLAYSRAHRNMHQSPRWQNGIVNGAVWYIIYGSLQDYMYDYRNSCIDLTLEVSNTKWPAGDRLPGFYDDNYNAMLTFIERSRDLWIARRIRAGNSTA